MPPVMGNTLGRYTFSHAWPMATKSQLVPSVSTGTVNPSSQLMALLFTDTGKTKWWQDHTLWLCGTKQADVTLIVVH